MRKTLIILILVVGVGLLACSSAQSSGKLPTWTPDLSATIQVDVQTAVAEQSSPTITVVPTAMPALALPTADSRLPKCRGLQVAGEWFSLRTRQKYTDEKITHGLIGTSIMMGGPELSWAEATELLRVCPGLLGISP